jgi:hypothetical protein
MWEPRRVTILRASTACYRDSFTFIIIIIIIGVPTPDCASGSISPEGALMEGSNTLG